MNYRIWIIFMTSASLSLFFSACNESTDSDTAETDSDSGNDSGANDADSDADTDSDSGNDSDTGASPANRFSPGTGPGTCAFDYAPLHYEVVNSETGEVVSASDLDYDDAGNLVHSVAFEGSAQHENNYVYDGYLLVSATRDVSVNGDLTQQSSLTIDYDSRFLPVSAMLTTTTTSDLDSDSQTDIFWRRFEFSCANDRINTMRVLSCVSEQDCSVEEEVIEFVYDAAGRVTQKNGITHAASYSYDGAGNLLESLVWRLDQTVLDKDGHRYTYENNRVTEDIELENLQPYAAKLYSYQNGRMDNWSLESYPDIGTMEYTDRGDMCSYMRAWSWMLFDWGSLSVSQRRSITAYGYGAPTGMFF